MINSKITGTGSYLPEKVLSNKDLEKIVETSDQWITERTGISERRIASPQENTSDLAAKASLEALKAAGITAQDLDFIFVATTSADQLMPNTACVLQKKIGANKIGSLDVMAACSGFLYALSMADLMIKNGTYKHILVVGAEILSRFTDYTDRGTCILFSDGAGAVVLSAEEGDESKVYAHNLRADGELGKHLTYQMGGSNIPPTHEVLEQRLHYIKMDGREIFKHATRAMAKCCEEVLKESDLPASAVDWLVPHQANLRIIESVAKRFDFPMEKVIVEIQKMGNNSSASIPICLDKAVKDGRIKRGQRLMLTAFGGGVTSGSLLMRY